MPLEEVHDEIENVINFIYHKKIITRIKCPIQKKVNGK